MALEVSAWGNRATMMMMLLLAGWRARRGEAAWGKDSQ